MIRLRPLPLLAALLLADSAAAVAQGGDPIGLQALRNLDPTLTGSGIIVAQPEAIYSGTDGYEVNPATVGQAAGKIIYTDTNGATGSGFPNNIGQESGHAGSVGENLYGDLNTSDPEGVAPGVAQIDNYEADYFYYTLISGSQPIAARIVNQSFVFGGATLAQQVQANQTYDNYAATFNTLFISGVGNGGAVQSPASSYNGIAVAAYDSGSNSSTGPTYDGRSKPDITAPATATSYSTPFVSGAAVLLLQAALRGDAGPGTASDAADSRLLKALLLNGAVKPAGWTHTATAPLDPTYGSGILNVYNSYLNLRAGEFASATATSGSLAAIDTGPTLPGQGWDLASITTAFNGGSYTSQSAHYLFDLTTSGSQQFTLTSTLTWWRQAGQAAINNLDLYLFNATTGTQIALSDSPVDNVQQLYVPGLTPGRYDLVVLKNGGTPLSGGGTVVSPSETYALAFNFAPIPEPSTFLLLSAALPLLTLLRKPAR